MEIIEAIEGLNTEVNDDGLTIKIKNKLEALRIKNKIERTGYKVDILDRKNKYVIKVWGAELGDAYLLKNNEGTAI